MRKQNVLKMLRKEGIKYICDIRLGELAVECGKCVIFIKDYYLIYIDTYNDKPLKYSICTDMEVLQFIKQTIELFDNCLLVAC